MFLFFLKTKVDLFCSLKSFCEYGEKVYRRFMYTKLGSRAFLIDIIGARLLVSVENIHSLMEILIVNLIPR